MNSPIATILIVDDEIRNCRLLEALLKPEGYLTISATSGEEALALIEQRAPDLILLDIMMPGMDGYHVASLLKTNPETSNIPIIMVTAHSDRSARLAGLNAGAEEFLTKPVDRAELWVRVRNLLRLKAFSDFLRDHGAILEQQVQERTAELQRTTELRLSEAANQVAVLNALPAHIALIDAKGFIISVNEAWRSFADLNVLHAPGHGVSLNYLDICDSASGDSASEARHVAAGIRSILAGELQTFSIEYACHSPTRQRWFLMRVTPLASGPLSSAVVMHLDISAERQANEDLQASESRFREVAENIREVFSLRNVADGKVLYVSPAYEQIWGRSCESISSDPESWAKSIHPDDRISALRRYEEVSLEHGHLIQYRIVRPDGAIRWIESRGYPVSDHTGKVVRLAGVSEDITERKQAEQELSESERRFSDMLGSVQLVSIMLDSEGRTTYCNDHFLKMTGWQREEVIGHDWFDKFVPFEDHHLREIFTALIADPPDIWHRENTILTRAGERRLIRWNITVLRSGDGAVIGTASIGEDVTEQKRAEIRIKYLNRVYAVLSGINTLIVRAHSLDELFKEACRIAVETGGFRMSMIGMLDKSAMKILPVASAGTDQGFLTAVKEILSSDEFAPSTMVGRATAEKRAVISNDSQHDPQVMFGRIYAESGVRSMAILPLIVAGESVGVLALYASEIEFFHAEEVALLTELAGDISFAIDHIEKEQKLNYLAYYDVLTGLANRSLFLERVGQYLRTAAANGQKLAIFLVDLERFKNINDSLGQAAGDSLLRQVAEWATHNISDATLLARLDADHFAVVLPEINQEGEVQHLLEKKMEAFLQHPFRLNDGVFRIAAKVGVAIFPEDAADTDTLFRNAEAALKKAKGSGDQYLFYAQKMNATVSGKLTLENQLRQALDNEEFVLHYQPKVNLASGKVTSAEALIRWNDPRTGLVPPGRFIPILEETGLIYDVGRWALHKAIEDYLCWRAAGLAVVRIAVNVSPMQLRNHGFIDEVKREIGINEHAAAGLELEITESLIMEDVQHNIASLKAIRDMGVTIAIDDFGTGFSSLSYLAKLPVNTLKIDRSFVIDMTASPEGLALVSTIINLAHALKLKVVAEGVETEEQSRLLHLLNCDEMQGFLFSKPVSGDIFASKYLASPNFELLLPADAAGPVR